MQYLMGKYVFEIHFDGDDQMDAILAPLIDCHNPAKTVSMEPNKNVDKLTFVCVACIFAEWPLGFYQPSLHSDNLKS